MFIISPTKLGGLMYNITIAVRNKTRYAYNNNNNYIQQIIHIQNSSFS